MKLRQTINEELNQMKKSALERGNALVSSESVGAGHPDKMADQISDLVVDTYLKQDSKARVAVETALKDSEVMLFGEVNSNAIQVPGQLPKLIKDHIANQVGFNNDEFGLNGNTCSVSLRIGQQADEIELGTRDAADVGSESQGAGDQGMMLGYACDETPEHMPLPIMLSHKMVKTLNSMMFETPQLGLRPDNKAMFTVEYDKNQNPLRVASIVVAQQHSPNVAQGKLEWIVKDAASAVVNGVGLDDDTIVIVNGTGGSFCLGGPHADAGLTGRKIIVDTYGSIGRHGGGAFSGKDPSKVDRSAAYMARYLAKQIVANGLASRAEVQLSYCIGIAEPVSVFVNTFGTAKGTDDYKLTQKIVSSFDLRPAAIIEFLGLKSFSYLQTATYGHFGWSDYPWEKVQSF